MSPLFQHNENKIFSYIIMFQISITCLLYFTETRTGQPASYNLCTSFFTTSDQKFEPCEMLTSNTSKGQPLSFLQLFSSLLSLFSSSGLFLFLQALFYLLCMCRCHAATAPTPHILLLCLTYQKQNIQEMISLCSSVITPDQYRKYCLSRRKLDSHVT